MSISAASPSNDQISMETQLQESRQPTQLFTSPSTLNSLFTSWPPAAAGATVVSPVAEGGVVPGSDTENQEPQLPLPAFQPRRPLPSGTTSDCPSESSLNVDTEDDFPSTFQHLESFYARLTEKERLPRRQGTSDWVISLARSHRRLSKEKRLRGHLRGALGSAVASTAAARSLNGSFNATPFDHGGSSNTDDSGYEGGYETDADESELSEWECHTTSPRLLMQRHKRKLDALANQLTMRLRVSEDARSVGSAGDGDDLFPPQKVQKGTVPVGVKLSLGPGIGLMPKQVPPVPLAFPTSSDNQGPYQKSMLPVPSMPPQFTSQSSGYQLPPQLTSSSNVTPMPPQFKGIMEVEPMSMLSALNTIQTTSETVHPAGNNHMDTS